MVVAQWLEIMNGGARRQYLHNIALSGNNRWRNGWQRKHHNANQRRQLMAGNSSSRVMAILLNSPSIFGVPWYAGLPGG